MPVRGKKGKTSGRKSTGKTGINKKIGQNEGVFHEIGRTNKGQGRMEEDYNY